MTDPTAICERLATLARAGLPVRAALEQLPERLGTDDAAVVAVGRRARLGGSIDSCLEPLGQMFGDALPGLRACLSGCGTDWARGVEEIAASITKRRAAERSAAISGAGATLSARIIAGLPLLMLPVAVNQMRDPLVAASVGLGLLLGLAGYRWLKRATPAAPADDIDAIVADEVAASLRAGASLHVAFTRALRSRPEMRAVLRRVDLGSAWHEALSPDLPVLASSLKDIERTGSPVVGSLCRMAQTMRSETNDRFATEVQRAPVKMVLPLVCCVLPSFVLVAIVPLLRGLAHPI